MATTDTTCPALVTRVHVALSRLERGRGAAMDVADLLSADPVRLAALVESWEHPGPVARFRELVERGATLEDCQEFLTCEPAWTAALFLTIGPSDGQAAAAWFATRRRARASV